MRGIDMNVVKVNAREFSVHLAYSSGNTVAGNKLATCIRYGMFLLWSDNNKIFGNLVETEDGARIFVVVF